MGSAGLVIIRMLTRHARTQFLKPNADDKEVTEAKFYSLSESDSGSEDDEKEKKAKAKKRVYVMDSDHRLLLQASKPLLQSSSAVSGPGCLDGVALFHQTHLEPTRSSCKIN
eukprot:m.242519 g.242519  ORF g.242519 m.242519 type:complete len:112 (+) comp40220_c1_seq11:1381-1716(+)